MAKHLNLAGSWSTVQQENLEEVLYKLEAPFLIRKAAGYMKPTQTVSFEDDKMKIVTVTLKTEENIVPLDGSEYKSELFSKPLVSVATINEDGSVTSKGKVGNMDMITTRKIDDAGQMVLTTKIDDVECKRVFVRN